MMLEYFAYTKLLQTFEQVVIDSDMIRSKDIMKCDCQLHNYQVVGKWSILNRAGRSTMLTLAPPSHSPVS